MKNISIFAIALVALLAPAKAQTLDTVTGPNGRLPGYHYTWWYDTCWYFFDTTYYSHGGKFPFKQETYYRDDKIWDAVPEIVDHPAAITGFGVWSAELYRPVLHLNNPRVPEYVVVFQYANDTMVFVDSARWDTAAPKIYKTPRHFDTARYGFFYFKFYEVHLKNNILVDSTFFLAVTSNNNKIIINTGMYFSEPTVYSIIFIQNHIGCGKPDTGWWFITRERDSIWEYFPDNNQYGPVQPMIDYAMVYTLSADSTMGSAYPNCKLSKHVNQTIYATPAPGYYFYQWDDGNTDNPRSVFITQDTSFTALFTDREAFHVTVQPDYHVRGHVTGGGTYFNGDTVTLTAIANENYRFLCWNDGDTSNPRQFTITHDTSFTAHFNWISQHEGISTPDDQKPLFSLTPNPAHNNVTVTINMSTPPPGSTLTLCDEAGRELFSTQISNLKFQFSILNYPAGTYFVTLHTPNASSTLRLVIN